MNDFTDRVKIKDLLFFTLLTMISIAVHAFLLFGFDLRLQPLAKRAERRMMKIDFVKGVKPDSERAPRFRPSPIPNPAVKERPKMKRNQPLPPTPALEEAEEVDEVPEAFSQFLDDLKDAERVVEFEFRGDSYDILEGSSPFVAPDEGSALGIPGIPANLLDPRVQMVVTRVPWNSGKSPPTFIETGFPQVKYPDLQIEKKDYQKGWQSVYLVLRIDSRGRIEGIDRVRPRKPDELQSVFVDTLLEAVNTWAFHEKKSFIHVDVRFYVE